MKKVIIAAIAGGMSLSVATVAISGGHAKKTPEEQAVAARKAQMGLFQYHMGKLGGMAKGEMEYDADAAMAAAQNIAALSTLAGGPMIVSGSAQGETDDSRLKATALGNVADYDAKSAKLSEAAMALVAVAGDGAQGLGPALGAIGGTCKGCHETYRGPRN